jgi:hypothetical protein
LRVPREARTIHRSDLLGRCDRALTDDLSPHLRTAARGARSAYLAAPVAVLRPEDHRRVDELLDPLAEVVAEERR